MDKKIITFGEIMLRLSAPGHLRFAQCNAYNAGFGGSEANVAVALAGYGLDAAFVTRLPKNEIAQACVMNLQQHAVDTSKIIYGGERIGLYFLETGAAARASKVIYDRANSAMASIEPGMINWDEAFSGADWFHWSGITPAVSASAAAACLEAIEAARRNNLTVSCDLNYRRNLWKYGKKAAEVMPELVSGCDLVLGNEEDAEMIFGIKPEGFDAARTGGELDVHAFESVCEQLTDMFPQVAKVALTLRGSVSASHNTWSGALYAGCRMYYSPRYEIMPIVDRVGAGDAFMAGLIYGLLTMNDNSRALNFAAAASCLKHTIAGDFNLSTVAETEKLMDGDMSGRVNR
ncbi:MAG: sugar kinase [Tannerellaceae bacterium]|jgi:2-dehydro-3-deoxygluconokinase|nr:sugar kinase [Tannerellaceae bacterium]